MPYQGVVLAGGLGETSRSLLEASDDGQHRDEDRPVVLDVYKVAVEMADRVSARRSLANDFYLTTHSAFVAGILVAVTGREQITAPTGVMLICIATAGKVLALLWWCSLVGHQRLNRAKYKAINHIEDAPPAKPTYQEWDLLEREHQDSRRHRYRELGWAERRVSLLFIALYVAVLVVEATQHYW